jgi:hypothetical protein
MKTNEARSLLRNMFEAAITAAQPATASRRTCPRRRAADCS